MKKQGLLTAVLMRTALPPCSAAADVAASDMIFQMSPTMKQRIRSGMLAIMT